VILTTSRSARALRKAVAICTARTDSSLCKALHPSIEIDINFLSMVNILLLYYYRNRECVIGDCKSIANCHQKGYLEETKVLPYCLNTSVQRRSYPKCEVFKTDACGFGLKVSDNVPRGTIIVEYTGEVITSSECSDRMRGMKGMLIFSVMANSSQTFLTSELSLESHRA
jgi:hypothetical protein